MKPLDPTSSPILEGARLRNRVGDEQAFARELEAAIWSGDTYRLHELAPCHCCCEEHTFSDCPARAWYGCRGQWSES